MRKSELEGWIASGTALRGLYGSEGLSSAQGRYRGLLQAYVEAFGEADMVPFSSPGRTEIGGNHTDHNHGRVLAGAVNLDNAALAATNGSNKVRVKSTGYPQFEVDLATLDPVAAEQYTSAALVRGVCATLKKMGLAIGGFDAVIDSGVPKGSGLSSSASFEVLIGAIVSHLFNAGKLDPVENAKVGQKAENLFFGKPCGLMDQTACSVGGLVTIDFADPANPVVEKVDFDFTAQGHALVITDTGGNHADLNDEYASLPAEMKSVAKALGKSVLREVTPGQLVASLGELRAKGLSDRALLRALHFEGDNERVPRQVDTLRRGDFAAFLALVSESGRSSFMYNQNVYPVNNVSEQGLSLALALSDVALGGRGAFRVHGGGFAGTIQAFVPDDLVDSYVDTLESVFGKGKCHKLFIRPQGAIRVD